MQIAANVYSPIAPRAPGNPATLIDKHTNKGEYQFRRNDTNEGGSLLRKRPALVAAHNEKRISGRHRLHSALEPSGHHRCDKNETNLNHSYRAKQSFLELFSSSFSGYPPHTQQTQPRHTNSQALIPLPIDPNTEIYDAEGKLYLEEALSVARSPFVVSEKPKPKCVIPYKSAPL
jgi:hypothetical protein